MTDLKVEADNDGELTPAQRAALRATDANTVAAIVNHYEPTEDLNQPAPYALTANGVLQPGGGTEASAAEPRVRGFESSPAGSAVD